MKTVLITGASGFVGRNVARTLPQYGYEVLTPPTSELNMIHQDVVLRYFGSHKINAIVHCAFRGLGPTGSRDPVQTFQDNIIMFENLALAQIDSRAIPNIIIGSGAEFDLRRDIRNEYEDHVFQCHPIDMYGLAKNLITRRALKGDITMPYILRLFGCFGADEKDTRFLKRSIHRIKEGLPIEINENKSMSYFFVEDIAPVIHRVIQSEDPVFRNMNLTYQENENKSTLYRLSEKLCEIMDVPDRIDFLHNDNGKSYTGNGAKLLSQNIPLIGLEAGMKRMVVELLK